MCCCSADSVRWIILYYYHVFIFLKLSFINLSIWNKLFILFNEYSLQKRRHHYIIKSFVFVFLLVLQKKKKNEKFWKISLMMMMIVRFDCWSISMWMNEWINNPIRIFEYTLFTPIRTYLSVCILNIEHRICLSLVGNLCLKKKINFLCNHRLFIQFLDL